MGKRTPLYQAHVDAGAKVVDFGGWDMPLNYGSQLEEHHQVRRDAGVFDVSHMTIVDMHGKRVRDFLRHLFANDVNRLQVKGKALYTCMLNERGGVIDDLIVYYLEDDFFRVVFNAGTRDKVLAWVTGHYGPYDIIMKERDDLAMIAVQGPNGRSKTHGVLGSAVTQAALGLTPFNAVQVGDVFIARTGYTGEDGYELMVPVERAPQVWNELVAAGIKPIGLAARDTLRLEAGMNLYGVDMDESISPLESGLGWTVAWEPEDRQFVGRASLEAQRRDENRQKFVGLVLDDKGVLRNHMTVVMDGRPAGEITSGGFAPTLGRSIAMARVPRDVGSTCQVDIRGRAATAIVVKPPFVRNGKSCLDIKL